MDFTSLQELEQQNEQSIGVPVQLPPKSMKSVSDLFDEPDVVTAEENEIAKAQTLAVLKMEEKSNEEDPDTILRQIQTYQEESAMTMISRNPSERPQQPVGEPVLLKSKNSSEAPQPAVAENEKEDEKMMKKPEKLTKMGPQQTSFQKLDDNFVVAASIRGKSFLSDIVKSELLGPMGSSRARARTRAGTMATQEILVYFFKTDLKAKVPVLVTSTIDIVLGQILEFYKKSSMNQIHLRFPDQPRCNSHHYMIARSMFD